MNLTMSRINLVIFFILITYSIFDYSLYYKSKIFWGDSISYYSYLPATIIYHDITLQFAAKAPEKYEGRMFYLLKGPNGNYIIKASSGLAWLLLPFFLLAHLYAHLTGWEANGFSEPYKVAIIIGMLVYLYFGFKILSKILLRYFSEPTTIITLLIIGLGTNLLCFSTIVAAVPHAYMFVLITFYIYYVIKWYERPSVLNSIILGLVGGLIVLARPNNIIILAILIFYDIRKPSDLWDKLKFFLRNYMQILIMFVFSLVFWLPQFYYWKLISGSYIFNSYPDASFHFNNPQVINQLFSYRKGWLLYSPLMALAFVGMIPLFLKLKRYFLVVLIFFLLNIFILSSWHSWWFAGSFGSRGYIDSYGLLALPIAAVVEFILSRRKTIYVGFLILAAAFSMLNMGQTVQYAYNYINGNAMTKDAYWSQFLRFGYSSDYNDKLLFPNIYNSMIGVYDPRLDYTYDDIQLMENEDTIQMYINRFRNDQKTMETIKEKAKKKGISLEKMLRLNAEWVIRMKIDETKMKRVKAEDEKE